MFKIKKEQRKFVDLCIFIFVVVSLASIIAIVSLTDCFSTPADYNEATKFVENIGMSIVAPNWNITYIGITTNNFTVADFLFECANYYNFTVESTYWKGYDSFFIESINGTENGKDGMYWQYYVNGEFADVGCSGYVLHDNDIVEWWFVPPFLDKLK